MYTNHGEERFLLVTIKKAINSKGVESLIRLGFICTIVIVQVLQHTGNP